MEHRLRDADVLRLTPRSILPVPSTTGWRALKTGGAFTARRGQLFDRASLRRGAFFVRVHFVVSVLLAVFWLGTDRVEAAYDVFFRFGPSGSAPSYLGESNDPQFNGTNGWTRLEDIQQGNNRPMTPEGGSALPVRWQLELTKAIDRGSPTLFQNGFTATLYRFADVVFRRQGPVDPKAAFISVAKLEDVSVRTFQHSGGQGSLKEKLALNFKRLQWTQYTVDALSRITWSTAHWNILTDEGGLGPLPGLILNPGTLRPWPAGMAYNQSFTTTGGWAPYRYALGSGQLPPGLTLANGGVLSGVASTPGNFTFSVVSTDDSFGFTERGYSLAITSACGAPPRFRSISVVGATVQLRLDGFPMCRYQLQLSPSPNGPWFDVGSVTTAPASGVIDWTDSGSLQRRYYRAVAAP
jgi:type VI protein secretion system component Hcp